MTLPLQQFLLALLYDTSASSTGSYIDQFAAVKMYKCFPVYHVRDIHKKFEFEHASETEGMFGL